MADRDSRLGKARPLGTPPIGRRDKLNAKDLDDLFRFSLSGKSSLDLDLSGMKKANFDVELYAFKVPSNQIPKKIRNLDFRKVKSSVRNRYLQLVGASKNGGTASEAIDTELEAGEYLVRVTRRKGNSKYLLNLNSTAVSTPTPTPDPNTPPGTSPGDPSNPGNSLSTAYTTTLPTPATTTATSRKVAGTVNNEDKQDYYKFTLAQSGTFTFNASNFQGKADLQILNGNGTAIQTYTLDSANPQRFDKALNAGTYYLRIYQEATGDSTTYSLTATKKATTSPTPTPTPKGNSFDNPLSATVPTSTSLAGNFTSTDKLDYYKFTATEGDYQFNLAGNAKIEFFNSNKQSIKTTYNSGETKFIQPLGTGTFYFKVSQRSAGATASYTVTASRMAADRVSNNVAAPTVINSLNSTLTKVSSNYVVDGGKKSPVDYYKFSLSEFSLVTAELRGMFDNLDVRLFNVNDAATGINKKTPYSSKSDTRELVFPGGLAAGDYILQVFAPTGEGSTYDLWIAAEPTDGKGYMVANINNKLGDQEGSSDPRNLVELGNAAFFVATDADNQTALYRTTGTSDKLSLIREFDSVDSGTVVTDNAFYFVANGGNGNELWQVTTAGEAKALTNFVSPTTDFDIDKVAAVGNYVYFTANIDDGQGKKLRRASLSSAQPTVDSSFATDLLADDISQLLVVDNAHLFFKSDKAGDSDGSELWRILNAGTAATVTPEMINLNIDVGSSPENLISVGNNTLYLTAYRDNSTRLVKLERILDTIDSNLNDANGLQATNINLGNNGFDGNLFLFQGGDGASDDILYFTADINGGAGGLELMALSNPQSATASSTLTTIDVRAGGGSSSPTNLVEFDGKLYFVANDGTSRKLWYLNGSTPTSIAEAQLDAADPSSTVPYTTPNSLTVVGNTLYLVAGSNTGTGDTGLELWQVKDNTLSLVQDLNLVVSDTSTNNTDSSSPGQLTTIGGSLFFVATDGLNGREVWALTPDNS